MTDTQGWLVAFTFLLIAVATLFAMKNWLRGWAARIGYFAAGAGAIALLRIANLPLRFFKGSIGDFLFAVLMIAWAFAGKTREEAVFRVPFALGFGLALLVVNIWAHV